MNAQAGKLHHNPGVEELQKLVDFLEVKAEVVGTTSENDFRQQLKQMVADGIPRVAVAGGDGTVAEAVQILAKTDTALGIIPQGTSNNFATALRLPMDLPSALRVLSDGEVKQVDLGCCFGRYFTETAGVGLFANALAIYGRDSNKDFLRATYALLKIVFSYRASRLTLTLDGVQHEEPAVFCVAANTYRMAQAMPIAPGAKVTDGLLDVVILGDLTRSELIPYLSAIRRQMHFALPKVKMARAREVSIDSRRRIPVHVDDSVRGVTPVKITAEPNALKVLVEKL